MGDLVIVGAGGNVPALFAPSAPAAERFIEFFTAGIRNPNTRSAYARAVGEFSNWCASVGITELTQVRPVHVAGFIETLKSNGLAAPSVKLKLAGVRSLFDWLVVGQVVPMNPAASVRGPKHSVKKGKTPVLVPEDARTLFDCIDITTLAGLRDRAVMALLFYSFARVSAALAMRVEDVYHLGRGRVAVRLHEKGGKEHEMPCHHNLQEYLLAYIEAAGLTDAKAWLFQSMPKHSRVLSGRPMTRDAVYKMIRRYLELAEVKTKAGCHSWRATGITQYLKNGGRLEVAQDMANHADMRTTRLYDRRNESVTLDEVERISL